MLISPAYAQNGAGGESGLVTLLPLVLIFVVFYFLLIRPQQKKVKQHRQMVEALRRGDQVVTAGGLIGRVTKVVGDNELQLELAENVRVRVVRSTIQEVLTKPEPSEKGKPAETQDGGKKEAASDAPKSGKGKGPLSGFFGGKSDK